ncbi:MAG: methyltransferase domain-containing protein [candidate division Zixibacteria bacterium]|nr:methyltransferase domain-containing protein [candidate division Zixibacteria bacterium]
MNDSDRLRKYYAERAPEYEQIYFRDVPERRRELADETVRLQKIARERNVLDIACGTGYWTSRMSQTARSIIAADISPEMLAEARAKEYHCPIDFVRCDLNRLPFAENSFDLITLGFWFSHQPRQSYEALFDSLIPLLTDTGLIWMIDNNPPAEGPDHESSGTDSQGNNLKKRRLDNGMEYIILKNYFVEDELRAIFSPRFHLKRLTYGDCYWSALLTIRQ